MSIDLFRDNKADYFAKSTLYDPVNNPTGTGSNIPMPQSLVLDDATSILKRVVSVGADGSIVYGPVFMDDTSSRTIASDYANDRYNLFVDTRTRPYKASVSSRLTLTGAQPASYTLTRYPNTDKAVVISQYYDATNTITGQSAKMVSAGSNVWVCSDCLVTALPDDGEEILLQVFNNTGAEVYQQTIYAKAAVIINEQLTYQPKVASISIKTTQMLDDGRIYVFEKQALSDLDFTITLTYADGSTRVVPIDNQRCFLYGVTDFTSSYAGMRQNITVRYALPATEVLNPDPAVPNAIAASIEVVVVPNKLASTFKLTAIPVWVNSAARYVMRYFYYTTDFTSAIDVSALVSITTGTYDGSLYGPYQVYTVSLDMSKVDATKYNTSALYTQQFAVRLQPYAAYDRYLIRDAMDSVFVYGVDATGNRRPVLHYDSSIQQYFIPSDIFLNTAAVVESFYTKASPPYNPLVSSVPVQPTHFLLRDPTSGAMLVQSPIALTDYTSAFAIVGDTTGSYVGNSVIVEFLEVVDAQTTNVLYGVPVDVYTGKYLGTSGTSGTTTGG